MSAALLPEVLAPFRADPAYAAVLLDIDGTLAPIVERAGEAHVPELARQLMIETAKRYALVACVSGRRASEARALRVGVGSEEGPPEIAADSDFLVDGTDGVPRLLEMLVAV